MIEFINDKQEKFLFVPVMHGAYNFAHEGRALPKNTHPEDTNIVISYSHTTTNGKGYDMFICDENSIIIGMAANVIADKIVDTQLVYPNYNKN